MTDNTSLSLVNELSSTIDLQSTLIRAEALFRRFQRTVEAIDKKHNFPLPSNALRQRDTRHMSLAPGRYPSPATSPNRAKGKAVQRSVSVSGPSGASSGADPDGRGGGMGEAIAKGIGGLETEKVISPELRGLLSTKVQVMEGREVREHGGGTA